MTDDDMINTNLPYSPEARARWRRLTVEKTNG